MRITTMGALAITVAMSARADDVTVYLQGVSLVPEAVLSRAQVLANEIFLGAGVRIHWRIGHPASSELVAQKPIVVEIGAETSRKLLPGALAFAQPYEGVHISVFYDRIQEAVLPDLTPNLLAHVLAHEITHILQGTDAHSATGVMKARWTFEDYRSMRSRPLSFTEEDVHLIHFGLAAHAGATRWSLPTLVH
jgi:hypothetical protein